MVRAADTFHFGLQALLRHRFRSAMILVAMAFGVAAVLVLTAAGEGARRFVLSEFSFLGKDILILLPGKKETTGGLPPMTGSAARAITLAELEQLQQRLSSVDIVAPIVVGSAEVSSGGLLRETMIVGTTPGFLELRQLAIAQGTNLPDNRLQEGGGQAVVGAVLRNELFASTPVLGTVLRIGDYRFRVVGVLEGHGDAMGEDLSDDIIVPIATAQRLFNLHGVLRAMIRVRPGFDVDAVKADIAAVMRDLHQGEEDVTVISPDSLLDTFDDILTTLTLGVAAIGGISLLVAGVLIMNVMMINVSQRTQEIGVLKALGASSADVLSLFLAEALVLVVTAAGLGWLAGVLLVEAARWLFPVIDFATPLWATVTALAVAVLTGLAFAYLPARRASRLLPVTAIQAR